MTKSEPVGVAWLVSATCSMLACGGQVTAEGGKSGPAPASAGGAGGVDAGVEVPPSDALVPIDVPIDVGSISVVQCVSLTLERSSVVSSCIYPVPVPDGAVFDPHHANLVYTASDQTVNLVIYDESVACDLGWRFVHDLSEIEICGAACDRIENDPAGELSLMFACDMPGPVT